MTQSNPTSIGEELLKQARTGNQAVDAGLAQLRQVIEAEQLRVRRLTRWTRIVWITAAACVVSVLISFIGYIWIGQRASTATAPPGLIWQILGLVSAGLFFAGVPTLLVCFVVGIVLLIMTILARRTAGMHEIRASLASIDAQLRVLELSEKKEDQSSGG